TSRRIQQKIKTDSAGPHMLIHPPNRRHVASTSPESAFVQPKMIATFDKSSETLLHSATEDPLS
ncbi:hypothetical protein Ancab_004730, partial [Ancistrocladus abbreviatus]